MISKRRMVEHDIFKHRDFRRADYVARELYMALIIMIADDEGRFVIDPEHLCDEVFSRRHDATEEQVADAIKWWADKGNVVIYDDGKHGFLAGWYEHQYIDKRVRSQSTLPQPPVVIHSWAVAEALVNVYKAELAATEGPSARQAQRVPIREACRWFQSIPENSGKYQKITEELQNALENSASRARTPSPSPSPKGDMRVRDRKRSLPGAIPTAPPALSEQERTDGERLRLPAATEALLSVFPDWKPAQVTEWISGAIRSVQSVAGQMVGLTDEMLATEIRRVPPVISKPGVWYVDKLIERLQRTPAARSGAPPEFIALEGECPEEEGGMQIWHYKLEKWLAQREQSAAG